MSRPTLLLSTLMITALAAGCSRSAPDRARPSQDPDQSTTTQTTQTRTSAPERALTVTGISLDPQLMSGCGITEVQTFFEFDSADVDPPEGTVLYQVAKCLSEGPLKGRAVRVVGYTDPRGPDRYNDELGKSRAQSVREYLVVHGVEHDAVEMMSMGEAGADEAAPAEWPYDRRVEIHLVP